MSQRMPPVQYIMTGVSGSRPCRAAGISSPLLSVGVSRNASCSAWNRNERSGRLGGCKNVCDLLIRSADGPNALCQRLPECILQRISCENKLSKNVASATSPILYINDERKRKELKIRITYNDFMV